MWQKPIKKTIFTVNMDNYDKRITDITYPLIELYARKINANFHIITKKKFPGWPVAYEKLQIYELARDQKNDWNIFIDSDAIVHPEAIDFTYYMTKDKILHNAVDMAAIRWRYDRYFWRDGRNIGSCNWLAIASDWCIELWRPLDMPFEEALSNIYPTVGEANSIVTPEHLIDDYALSRNIAKYGLKLITMKELLTPIGQGDAGFFWHIYNVELEEKLKQMREYITKWGLTRYIGGA